MRQTTFELREVQKTQKIKGCPYCGNHLSFTQFFMNCNSDAFVEHQSTLGTRVREHVCPQCLKIYRIEYHLHALEKAFEKYAVVLIPIAVIIFLMVNFFLKAGVLVSICLDALALLAISPFAIKWIQYESIEIYPASCKVFQHDLTL